MYNVAVVGATGAVGTEMINILKERKFPVSELRPLASERSIGQPIEFNNKKVPVKLLNSDSFKNIDIALFSAGSERSLEYGPIAAKSGTLVIDNSPAFREDNDVPLIVPEINPKEISNCPRNIIANPNCAVIQIAVATYPIHKQAKIKRAVISTYQAASGAGRKAMDELTNHTRALFAGTELEIEIFERSLAFNCLPMIGSVQPSNFTSEEEKIAAEIPKIFDSSKIKIAPTAVRVPVFFGHSASVSLELESSLDAKDAEKLLSNSPGIIFHNDYPTPREIAGSDEVHVGRIRNDSTVQNGLLLWIVADNLRKGAALNTIQIAETAVKKGMINK